MISGKAENQDVASYTQWLTYVSMQPDIVQNEQGSDTKQYDGRMYTHVGPAGARLAKV